MRASGLFFGGLLPLPGAPDGYFLVLGTFFSNCGGDVLIDGVMKLSDKTVGGPANALKCGRTDVKNSGVVVIKNELRYYSMNYTHLSAGRDHKESEKENCE